MTKSYYTVGGQILGEKATGGSRTDYLPDALGSVTATVDQASIVQNTYRYKPFGTELVKTGTAPDPRPLWQGLWFGFESTAAVAILSQAQRVYSPGAGRWDNVAGRFRGFLVMGLEINPYAFQRPGFLSSEAVGPTASSYALLQRPPQQSPNCIYFCKPKMHRVKWLKPKCTIEPNGLGYEIKAYVPAKFHCDIECEREKYCTICTQPEWCSITQRRKGTVTIGGATQSVPWTPDNHIAIDGPFRKGPCRFLMRSSDAPGNHGPRPDVVDYDPELTAFVPINTAHLPLGFDMTFETKCTCGDCESVASWKAHFSVTKADLVSGTCPVGPPGP